MRPPFSESAGDEADRLLQICAEAVSLPTTATFWENLVSHLAKALHSDWAVIGELVPGTDQVLQTLAVCHLGVRVPNFRVRLEGCPCKDIYSEEPCIQLSGLQSVSNNPWFAEIGAEAYGRVSILDSMSRLRGMLAVVHSEPMRDAERMSAVLRIFRFRATSEFERILADQHFYEDLLRRGA